MVSGASGTSGDEVVTTLVDEPMDYPEEEEDSEGEELIEV